MHLLNAAAQTALENAEGFFAGAVPGIDYFHTGFPEPVCESENFGLCFVMEMKSADNGMDCFAGESFRGFTDNTVCAAVAAAVCKAGHRGVRQL